MAIDGNVLIGAGGLVFAGTASLVAATQARRNQGAIEQVHKVVNGTANGGEGLGEAVHHLRELVSRQTESMAYAHETAHEMKDWLVIVDSKLSAVLARLPEAESAPETERKTRRRRPRKAGS